MSRQRFLVEGIYDDEPQITADLVLTADHGNADCMFTEKNGRREAMVAHTLNPVPFVVKDFSGANRLSLTTIPTPGLGNVAATLLVLLGYQKPDDYDASLVAVG